METDVIEELTTQLDNLLPNPAVESFSTHSRISLYKNYGRAVDQERRWRQQLEVIRRRNAKQKQFDEQRNVTPVFSDDSHDTLSHPWLSKPKGYRGNSWRSFSNHLMLAEWFLFMPPTFEIDYLMKLCPKGRQVLVSAAKGHTKIYSRTGKRLLSTVSRLPGGGLKQSPTQNRSNHSMLDCILLSSGMASTDELTENSIVECYVLDLLRFRNTDYTKIPYRERCSWLENYLRDELEQAGNEDRVRFKVIQSHPCDRNSLSSVFSRQPDHEVDGVLFHHELVLYEPGATPLVTWLKPYMLREWFPDIDVHPHYMADIPADYTTYLEHVRSQEDEAKTRRQTKP